MLTLYILQKQKHKLLQKSSVFLSKCSYSFHVKLICIVYCNSLAALSNMSLASLILYLICLLKMTFINQTTITNAFL